MAISDFKELKGYPQFSYSASGQEYTRKFHGPWADRFTFVDDQLSKGFMSFPVIDAQVDPYQDTCAKEQVYATMITNGNNYLTAEVTIRYGFTLQSASGSGKGGRGGQQRPNSITKAADQTILTYSATGSTQLTTVPGRGLKWFDDTPVNADFGDVLKTGLVTHEFSWLGISTTQINAIEDLTQKVNSSAVTIPIVGRSVPEHQLLLEDYSIKLTVDAGSSVTLKWEGQMKFLERAISWKKFYRPDTQLWETLTLE